MSDPAAHLALDDQAYPECLRDLPRPPRRLYFTGDRALLARPMVAIVGTRDASLYGERTARRLASALAAAGVTVVSGMARGIDAAAHEGALGVRGGTIAVLGTGVDIAYPAMHRALHRRIASEGLLLSELSEGAAAHRGSFPNRNRIIAALALATIVVEAGHRSGALITASVALELGRTVAAVPGPIDEARHAGSNELLRDGAVVIAGVDDALALFGLAGSHASARAHPPLDADASEVWDALAAGPRDADALVAATSLGAPRCLAAITALEMAGLVDCAMTGAIARR